MKKDYSKIFSHYYGLQYDGNVIEMIKIHELMELAGIAVSGSTKSKLEAYSDKRPFKVNYFISKVGKTLKWCPTSSVTKFNNMTLMPVEWWFEQLTDTVPVEPTTPLKLPEDWLSLQLTEHVRSMLLNDSPVTTSAKILYPDLKDILVEESIVITEEYTSLSTEEDDTYLPF